MRVKSKCVFLTMFFILSVLAASAVADVDGISKASSEMKPFKAISGDGKFSSPSFGPSNTALGPNPPGDTVGITRYEYQHNGSPGRNVVYTPSFGGNEYVHFLWMKTATGQTFRKIAYNAYNITGGTYQHGFGVNGGTLVSGNNGGYCTIDVTEDGVAVAFWHEGPSAALYQTRSGIDDNPPLGLFDLNVAPFPPNCEGEVSGTQEADTYIWPVGEYQKLSGGDVVLHMVSTESPPEANPESIQSIIYYRYVNGNLDECTGSPGDTLGKYISASHSINAIVRSDPNPSSDNVAIVWLEPFYEIGDPNNSCDGVGDVDVDTFLWTQHDVVYMESTDGGATFGSMVNVTDYTDGHTLDPIDFVDKAMNEVTALYDSDGDLHIVWITPDFRLDTDPCQPLYRCRLWHWDQGSGQIALVLDATAPTGFCSAGIGGNLGAIARPNISECDGNLFVSFTRYGIVDRNDNCGDCSAGGHANGDFCLTASSDGGVTWGPDGTVPVFDTLGAHGTATPVKKDTYVDLTNTWTDGCAAGDCTSETHGTMAKYSTSSLHLFYVDDHDGGSFINDEGEETDNELLYTTYPCFSPEAIFAYNVNPESQWEVIAPDDGVDCTEPQSKTFDITVTNTGNVSIDYEATESETWMSLTGASGTVTAGVNTVATITVNLGTVTGEAYFTGNVHLELTSTEGSASLDIEVELLVSCSYEAPDYVTLSTSCWSVGVWNVPRAGLAQRSELGNMYWFSDEFGPMYDEGFIVSYASDAQKTYYSMFDGSDSSVSLVATDSLITMTTGNYEYAHGSWATPEDSAIVGEVEYYLPTHPDTCVLIERIKVCNDTDGDFTVHLGEGIDWDFPDDEDGSANRSGADESRQMVYQYGPSGASSENYFGGASFCGDIPGAIVLENDVWVYPNTGYVPGDIADLLATHTGFDASDSVEDVNSVYVVAQNLTLAPQACTVFCKVKASSLTGLGDLQDLIDKGKDFIRANSIDCPACAGPSCAPGDANGSGGDIPVDIDDAVYLINFIFGGGPPPVEDLCCGDANASGGDIPVDIDDVVYIINFIFGGGPAPLPAC